jgi:signal transduction histidine kinase
MRSSGQSRYDREMRLSEFILRESEAIVRHWESFAAQLPPGAQMDSLALRDHAVQILQAIAHDLETFQSREAQTEKSLGRKPVAVGAPETAAQTHAILRARSGFDINQLAAEYRALRASVLRLWTDAHPPTDATQFEQVIRFNEAVDEALTESISFFHLQVEQARNLLLGMLGHDLRSPLQSIQMTATYLSALNAGSDVSSAAARLINSGSRMKALLDDLVDFNRSALGLGINIRPSPIDAASALTDEINLLRAAHPTRRLDLEVTGDTRGVWDGMRLRQVLANLIENAIKYGDEDAPIQIALRGRGDEFCFAVTNRGRPIERSALKTIFEPLHRNIASETKDSGGSLGLGLYIASQIVQAHGGEIEVRSDEARTVFEVLLPRAAEDPRRVP